MPIQIQPQIFCLLSLVSWGQILHYNGGWSAWKASLISAATAATFGGVELVLILTLRPLYLRGIAWPLMIVGITAAILLAAGLLPPYYELWKRGGRVVGIHWGFLTIDWLGAFFSLMGVIAQNTFDPLGGCLFIVWYASRLLHIPEGTHSISLSNIKPQYRDRRRHLRFSRHLAHSHTQTPCQS